jgi:hypothetical protein
MEVTTSNTARTFATYTRVCDTERSGACEDE